MIQRLFTFASAMSLLLCVAVLAMCIRSYIVADFFDWDYESHVAFVSRGEFGWEQLCLLHTGPDEGGLNHTECEPMKLPWSELHGFVRPELGLAFGHTDREISTLIAVPAWLLVGLTGVMPLKWASAWRRRLRRATGETICAETGSQSPPARGPLTCSIQNDRAA